MTLLLGQKQIPCDVLKLASIYTEHIADLCTTAVSRATFVHLMTRLMPA